jgi:large subunit ribosomal protein L18
MMKDLKLQQAARRRARVRARISGTATRPRLSVAITNKHITAQLIDDTLGKTLAHATTTRTESKGTMTEKAAAIGQEIAEQAAKHKIKLAAFDRGSRSYQGRLHALAEAARAKGLEF